MHAQSDVDLGVLPERADPPLQDRARLLHDLPGRCPGQEVDLAILLALKRDQDHRKYLELERRLVAEAVAGASARG